VKPWIVNASPLILLGKIGKLGVLPLLAPAIRIPQAVSSEILAGCDLDQAKIWIRGEGKPYVLTEDRPVSRDVVAWDLGDGETAVISDALCCPEAVCVLDDLAARRCAKVFGIAVMGTLGVLLKAKAAGLVPALSPAIEDLVAAGSMLAPKVIEEALHLAGE
jgi:predicted nucleic acid-binding protein